MHLINLKEKWFHLQKTVDIESWIFFKGDSPQKNLGKYLELSNLSILVTLSPKRGV